MSKISRGNLKQAFDVLRVVENRTLKVIAEHFWLETYTNGREKGFAITSFRTKIAFSEYRSSDSIVVYEGKNVDFSLAGNMPSDEIYRDKKFFSTVEAAADHIRDRMKNIKADEARNRRMEKVA